MSGKFKQRLQNEFNNMQKNPLSTISVRLPDESDLYRWEATIFGPDDSPYSGGVFILTISLSINWPWSTPKIDFRTRIYHPNINAYGNICFDRESFWTPATRIEKLLLSISSLMEEPNTGDNDILCPEIAYIYNTNREKYEANAREWTAKYAMNDANY